MDRTSYDCNYSEFDLSKHKKTYVNYLEVIIDSSGKVMYAVPSHQEKLVSIAMEYLGVSREELWRMCPPDYYFDVITWLCMITSCVSVWTNGFIGSPNKIQKLKLMELKSNGVYRGDVM